VLKQTPAKTCGHAEEEEPMPEQVCWQDLLPHGGLALEQSVSEGLHSVGRTHAAAVCEELQPVGRTHVGEVCGELSSCWSRERV